jgi:hypothetical protein
LKTETKTCKFLFADWDRNEPLRGEKKGDFLSGDTRFIFCCQKQIESICFRQQQKNSCISTQKMTCFDSDYSTRFFFVSLLKKKHTRFKNKKNSCIIQLFLLPKTKNFCCRKQRAIIKCVWLNVCKYI